MYCNFICLCVTAVYPSMVLAKYLRCQLHCTPLKTSFLQSQYQTELTEDTEVTNIGLIIRETFCAIAASSASADTVCFVKIVEECVAAHDIDDDYADKISQGQQYVVTNKIN